jgi:altronate dehydratase small subunit
MESQSVVLVFNARDNVGTAIRELSSGEVLSVKHPSCAEVKTRENVPYGFKLALIDIPEGGEIIKYGEVIGHSTRHILPGEMVHVHNIKGKRGRGDLAPNATGEAGH